MATPSPNVTVDPAEVTRTVDDLYPTITITEDGEHDPEAESRTYRIEDHSGEEPEVLETIENDSAEITYQVELPPGEFEAVASVTNDDGTEEDSATFEVIDGVASAGSEALITDSNGNTRVAPLSLPWEYQDGLTATPGMPTAVGLANARTFGTTEP